MEARKFALTLLALLAIGLFALAFEWFRDRGRHWLLLIGGALVALTFALFVHLKPAGAHDHHRPELKTWFEGLQARNKVSCCDGFDAVRVDDVDWESKDGRYRVRIDGLWHDVPDSAVVDGPNKAGPAMVWPSVGYMGLTIRCFMPGAGS